MKAQNESIFGAGRVSITDAGNFASKNHGYLLIQFVHSAKRTTLRTKGLTTFTDEKISPSTSNIISHTENCPKRPATYDFGASSDVEEQPAPTKQQQLMRGFIQRGIEKPEKRCLPVTMKGFREHFVKGIIQDDLPYRFGEKGGMKATFEYLLPDQDKFYVPNGIMVCRDLDVLYRKMNSIINDHLQACPLTLMEG